MSHLSNSIGDVYDFRTDSHLHQQTSAIVTKDLELSKPQISLFKKSYYFSSLKNSTSVTYDILLNSIKLSGSDELVNKCMLEICKWQLETKILHVDVQKRLGEKLAKLLPFLERINESNEIQVEECNEHEPNHECLALFYNKIDKDSAFKEFSKRLGCSREGFDLSKDRIKTRIRGISLSVFGGDITEEEVDVIVCSTPANLANLSIRVISNAVLQKSGPALHGKVNNSDRAICGAKTIDKSHSISLNNKKKIDNLKPHEIEILYKTGFITKLSNAELIAKHKLSSKPPVFIGSPDGIKDAQYQLLLHLRTFKQEELSIMDEMPDKNKKSKMLDKIISTLQEKFLNDPVAFEKKTNCIVLHSIDAEHIGLVKKYLSAYPYEEFFPVNDDIKFEYMETNLSKELAQLTASEDFINIYARKTLTDQGYVIVAFGNKQDFDLASAELDRLIKSIEATEMTLNMINVSEEAEIMMAGIKSKLNVSVQVLNDGKSRVGPPNSAIINGILISLVAEKLEDQKVDVIVNSTRKDFILNSGQVSKALLLKAGFKLQKECYTKGTLDIGQVIETNGHNLLCKSVFHCFAKAWKNSNPKECQEVLTKIVYTCLEMVNEKGLASIAFPPIACGYLKVPAKHCADSFFDAIEKFAWMSQHTLKNIKIVIFDPEDIILNAFQESIDARLKNSNSPWEYTDGLKTYVVGSSNESIKKACTSLLKIK